MLKTLNLLNDFVYSCGVAIPISGVLKVKNEIIEGIISHYAVVSDGLFLVSLFIYIDTDAYQS